MILHIDTTEHGKVKLSLKGARLVAHASKECEKLSEELLIFLRQFLRKHKIKLSDLKKISVNHGPGGFSAVRTGVAAANALNFALGLSQKIVLPKYDRKPHITNPKSR